MKAFYTLLIILIPFVCFGQNDTIFYNTDYLKIKYSKKLKQPYSIKYLVSDNTGYGYLDKKTLKKISNYTSSNSDYVNNDYDKGHMAPIKHLIGHNNFNIDSVNNYYNVSLMHYVLNRGIYKELEDIVLNIKMSNPKVIDVCVYIEPQFLDTIKTETGATIPTSFIYKYELIYNIDFNSKHKKIKKYKPSKTYEFPNNSSVKKKKLKEFEIEDGPSIQIVKLPIYEKLDSKNYNTTTYEQALFIQKELLETIKYKPLNTHTTVEFDAELIKYESLEPITLELEKFKKYETLKPIILELEAEIIKYEPLQPKTIELEKFKKYETLKPIILELEAELIKLKQLEPITVEFVAELIKYELLEYEIKSDSTVIFKSISELK